MMTMMVMMMMTTTTMTLAPDCEVDTGDDVNDDNDEVDSDDGGDDNEDDDTGIASGDEGDVASDEGECDDDDDNEDVDDEPVDDPASVTVTGCRWFPSAASTGHCPCKAVESLDASSGLRGSVEERYTLLWEVGGVEVDVWLSSSSAVRDLSRWRVMLGMEQRTN